MFQQVAVGHIGKLLRRRMIKLHQHFTDVTFHADGIFPAAAVRGWRLAVLAEDTELGAVDMERMQHHVALTRYHPALILASGRGKHRHIHVEGFAVDAVGVMEIKPLA